MLVPNRVSGNEISCLSSSCNVRPSMLRTQSRSDQTNVTVDGVDNNDQLSGNAFGGVLRIPMDSLEEFRVTTTNSNADSGRSSGAQVSLVTKAGTNQFHGSA